jgi:hypothetical protein
MWWKYTTGAGIVLTILTLARQVGGFENRQLALWLVVLAAAVLLFFFVLAVRDFVLRRRSLPEHRPKVVPDRYGVSPQRITSEGLHLGNHGEVAIDVQAKPLSLPDQWTVRFDGIGRLNGDGFMLATFHQNATQSTSSLDYLWRNAFEKEWQSKIVPLTLTYKDLEGRSYRSLCELYRDVKNYPGFAVRFIRQELI